MKKIFIIMQHDDLGSYPACCASNFVTAKKLLKLKRLRFPQYDWTINVIEHLWRSADNAALDAVINYTNTLK